MEKLMLNAVQRGSKEMESLIKLLGKDRTNEENFPATFNALRSKNSDSNTDFYIYFQLLTLHKRNGRIFTSIAVWFDEKIFQELKNGYSVMETKIINKNAQVAGEIRHTFVSNCIVANFSLHESYRESVIYLNFFRTSNSVLFATKSIDLKEYSIIDFDYQINDPARNPNHEDSDKYINVCYYSMYSKKNNIDYSNYVQPLYVTLPSKGKITLKDQNSFDYINSGSIFIENLSVSGIHASRQLNASECLANGKNLSWDSSAQWPITAWEFNKCCTALMEYTFSISGFLKGGSRFAFSISNSVNNSADITILPIRSIYGCLQEDTKITMADGSLKTIKSVDAGDKIKCANGKEMEVLNIFKTKAFDMFIHIVLENGLEIYSTAAHPFVNESGYVSANAITPEMKLKTENGSFVKVKESCAVELGETDSYNLELNSEAESEFIANGFVAGDITVQNDVRLKENDIKNMIDKKWHKDFESLKNIGVCHECV